MGATKLLAERLMASANNYKGNKSTIFASVRFGNVLASRGSVVPIFLNQIKKGGPITITDPNMSRFVMSISQSVNLILKATIIAKGGEIFILDMPALRIGDLAEVMSEMYAPIYGWNYRNIKINKIGMRPGEKYHEELMTHFEVGNARKFDGMYIISPDMLAKNNAKNISDYNSSQARLLSKKEIKRILKNLKEVSEWVYVKR